MRLADCFINVFVEIHKRYRKTSSDQRPDPNHEIERETIKKLLEHSKNEALKKFSSAEYYEANFAVCAWIDETIKKSSWESKDQWDERPLQLEYYDTIEAGKLFFDKIEDFAMSENETIVNDRHTNRLVTPPFKGLLDYIEIYDFKKKLAFLRLPFFNSDNSKYKPVREVYYMCLTLGFKGKYSDNTERINELKQENKDLLLDGFDHEGKIFQDLAYYIAEDENKEYSSHEKKKEKNFISIRNICFFVFPIILYLCIRFCLNEALNKIMEL